MSKLSKLNDVGFELDFSDLTESFGERPLLLGWVVDDPVKIMLGGGFGAFVSLALPGVGLILAGGIVYTVVNDTVWAFRGEYPDDDNFDGETVDAKVEEVPESDPVAQAREQAPDNWVDASLESGDYEMPQSNPQQWPPAAVNDRLNEMVYTEAKDMVAEGPQAVLELLGDTAPEWVRRAAAGVPWQTAAHTQESLGVTRGDRVWVTPVTPKSDRLTNGFRDTQRGSGAETWSQSAGDTAHEPSVTVGDISLNAYVNGLSLTEFKNEFCQQGGELEAADLNSEPGQLNAIGYIDQFVQHYGFTPVEFCVWWGWGLTKKGGNTPGAQKYRFVATFVKTTLDVMRRK